MYSELEKTPPYNDTVIEINDNNNTSVCSWTKILFGSIAVFSCAGAAYLLTSFFQEQDDNIVHIAGKLSCGNDLLDPLN